MHESLGNVYQNEMSRTDIKDGEMELQKRIRLIGERGLEVK